MLLSFYKYILSGKGLQINEENEIKMDYITFWCYPICEEVLLWI